MRAALACERMADIANLCPQGGPAAHGQHLTFFCLA
jgi:hypothetical protein